MQIYEDDYQINENEDFYILTAVFNSPNSFALKTGSSAMVDILHRSIGEVSMVSYTPTSIGREGASKWACEKAQEAIAQWEKTIEAHNHRLRKPQPLGNFFDNFIPYVKGIISHPQLSKALELGQAPDFRLELFGVNYPRFFANGEYHHFVDHEVKYHRDGWFYISQGKSRGSGWAYYNDGTIKISVPK